MQQRRKYAPPCVLQQAGLMLEKDFLVDSRDLTMYLESMDISVQEYSFSDSEAVGDNLINPLWD